MKVKEFTFISVFFIGIARLSSGLWQNCVQNPIDLVLVLDGSGSVGRNRFGLFKEFVQKLILQVNVAETGTKVALIQLSDIKATEFEFGINNHSTVSTMNEAIENIKYQYGKLQQTEIALRMAETKIFNGENTTDRSWAQNVLVLIAEGQSTYPVTNVIREATHLKDSGVRLVTIGVGRRITEPDFRNELYAMASSPQDVFFTSDDDILDVVDDLDGKLCPNITASSSVQHSSFTTKISATPVIPAKVITSVVMKTITVWMTSYVAPAICETSIATSSVTSPSLPRSLHSITSTREITPTTSITKQLKIPTVVKKGTVKKKTAKVKKFSGKLLECFTCNYNEDVAKEFSIDCERQKCARDEIYCADAVLEHAGKRFVRKRCASSEFCNSTAEICVRDFRHRGEYTDCNVKCCAGNFCNPYSRASTASVYMKFLSPFLVPLVKFITDNH